ncbi:WapI family immunity protein [Tengunoibacter tsumagoiensis]|uniref:Uncharacterized protein n=1 Tax=Tengunoibacter tsumagoiensis TaxID=2014871 RepID=A0A402A3F5_9CHLR|nr:hypothetical protein [Tengunoibacter tsumagoiensis]GCE13575.1 hypothetical protein KTT_34340 [Tengunoibacter tsumagoiensis]
MLFKSTDNSEVEIRIAGFRRKNHVRGEWDDSDWLKVHIRVLAPFGSTSYAFRCLLNWEAEQLAEWLMQIAKKQDVEREIFFSEGELRFKIVEISNVDLTIRFYTMRAIGKWTMSEEYKDTKDLFDDDFPYVDLNMSFNQLQYVAAQFQTEIAGLPLRK